MEMVEKSGASAFLTGAVSWRGMKPCQDDDVSPDVVIVVFKHSSLGDDYKSEEIR